MEEIEFLQDVVELTRTQNILFGQSKVVNALEKDGELPPSLAKQSDPPQAP